MLDGVISKLRYRMRPASSAGASAVTPEPPSVPIGSCPSAAGLPDLWRFGDIRVEPARDQHMVFARGGPVWPDFDAQTSIRQCRAGKPVDRLPDSAPGDPVVLDQPCVWGGQVFRHFGHFVAEFATRLLHSKAKRPHDLYLFQVPPGQDLSYVPDYFWHVLAWYGIARDQVRFVTDRPYLVRELWVAPQAEQLPDIGPSEAYLDLLDDLGRLQGIAVAPMGVTYVSRSGLHAGHGRQAGEGYLDTCLQRLGIDILHPERKTLHQQMQVYAASSTLVFSEGSALHGRQLIGRVPQKIQVLNRRKGKRTAQGILAPRCRSIGYTEAVAGELCVLMEDGRPRSQSGLGSFDLDAVFAAFRELGFDLTTVWSQTDYETALEKDLLAWAAFSFRPERNAPIDASLAVLGEQTASLGLQRYMERIERLASGQISRNSVRQTPPKG